VVVVALAPPPVVVLLLPVLLLALALGFEASATTPPNGPPGGEVAFPTLRASAAYDSNVCAWDGLMTPTMPLRQRWPVFWEQ